MGLRAQEPGSTGPCLNPQLESEKQTNGLAYVSLVLKQPQLSWRGR